MHKKRFLGLLLFSWLILFSISQNRVPSFTQLEQAYKEADIIYHRALQVNPVTQEQEERESKLNQTALSKFLAVERSLTAQGRSDDSLHFYLSLKIAELTHYFDSLSLALHYYQQAISLKSKLPAIADSLVFRPYLFCGHIYFYRNQLDSARFCFKQAEKIQDHYSRKINESERLYNDLGVLYFQAGNYREASNYFEKALQILEKSNPYYQDFYVNYSINSAIAFFKQDEFNKAEQQLKSLLPYQQHLNEIYNNLGLVEQKQGRYEQAINWFDKVHYGNPLDIGLENDKAGSWLSLGRLDSAGSGLQAAYKLHEHYNGSQTGTDHGFTLKINGDLEQQNQNYIRALSLYQKALHQFYPSFVDTSISSNPVRFSGYFSYINLFHTLVAKAQTLHALFLKSHQLIWAHEELESYEAGYALIDYIERVFQSDEARLFLGRSKYLIRDQPINIAFELYRQTNDNSFLEKAYILDQKSKASVLAFNEQRNQLLPASAPLRSQEQELKADITRLSLSAASITDSIELNAASNNIRDLEIKLNKVQESLAESGPSVGVVIPKIKDIQSHLLDASTSLISYHLGETKLTVFCITQSGFCAFQQNLYHGFLDDLNVFMQQLRTPADALPSDSIRNKLSIFLLKDLIIKDQARLVIIPDEQLSYLPFEALFFENNFLITHCSVQYQYSTALIKKETTDFKNSNLVSYAPFTNQGFTDSNLKLEPLPYSDQEIRNLGGASYTGKEATKKSFLQHTKGSTIIHLATHAVASDSIKQSSYIVFAPWNQASHNDFLLFSPEIYNLSLSDAKLIILSACETGTGPLVQGEGVMSLTRAFAYAGCPNIITSLWKADDESTTYITRKMHAYLQKGYAVDLALQQAQKDYLSDPGIHPRRKQPAYWAHLVFIGNYHPDAGSSLWWIALSGAVIMGLLIWLFIKKRVRVNLM